jgi:hypothetical protein
MFNLCAGGSGSTDRRIRPLHTFSKASLENRAGLADITGLRRFLSS